MRIAILGAGQLATELMRAEWPASSQLTLLTRKELDVTDGAAVERALQGVNLVMNATAYTAVDKAESEEAAAYRVNREAPAHLAATCRDLGAPLFHVSTDYVFDGSKVGAYVEDDATAPLGVYGASKLAGELAIRSAWEQHVIVRTSWVVSAFGNNFVKTMLRLAAERDRLRVVADQFGRPTPAKDLARVLAQVATRYASGSPIPWGTYHYAAAGRTSWHELASKVVELQAERTGRRPPVDPIATSEYPTPARRPANSELDTRKIEAALGFSAPPWQAGVEDIVRELTQPR